MSAFQYQLHRSYNSFHVDSVTLPGSNNFNMSGFLEEPNNSSSIIVPNYINSKFHQPESFIMEMDSSSVTEKRESRDQINSMDSQRKTSEESSNSMTSTQSKNVREGDHGKKQRKRNGHAVTKDSCNEKKAKKDEKKVATEEAPTGYIHVRARRGQATDSHSLAERVRREKISERMKVLQALVPGCDKVTGKALMLDEIINYVQSLQNQIGFLSMKLASLEPMYHDFGTELDALMVRPDQSLSGLGAQVANTNGGYPLLDSSASLMFQQFNFSNPTSQGNGQLLWAVDDQRQKLINHSGLSNNMCSFHI